MDQDEVMVRLSRDEALVLFEWLSRTDEAANHLHDLVEDKAEQVALWNLTCVLERRLVEPLPPTYGELIAQARTRLRDST